MSVPRRGRPRDPVVDAKIMKTALALVKKHGIRTVTLEMIAEVSGIARTTIYRRWRNRSAILADAFLMRVQPLVNFPEHVSAVENLRLQMRLLAKTFRDNEGKLLRSLLAEAQFDSELRIALRDRWISPRRAAARAVIANGVSQGQLPKSISPDILLDILYGGLYYWLLIEPDMLTDAYVDSVFRTVMTNVIGRD